MSTPRHPVQQITPLTSTMRTQTAVAAILLACVGFARAQLQSSKPGASSKPCMHIIRLRFPDPACMEDHLLCYGVGCADLHALRTACLAPVFCRHSLSGCIGLFAAFCPAGKGRCSCRSCPAAKRFGWLLVVLSYRVSVTITRFVSVFDVFWCCLAQLSAGLCFCTRSAPTWS